MRHDIIAESSDDLFRRVIAMVALGLFLLVGGYLMWRHLGNGGSLPSISTDDVSVTSLFIMSIMGGFFFIPVPIEGMFYFGLRAGNPAVLSMVVAIVGFVIGNAVSYLVGWKLFRVVVSLVPAKKLHAVRAKMIRWGPWAILIMNLVPSPSPLLTFALGIARYNAARLFTLLVIGNVIKYTVIILLNGGFI